MRGCLVAGISDIALFGIYLDGVYNRKNEKELFEKMKSSYFGKTKCINFILFLNRVLLFKHQSNNV